MVVIPVADSLSDGDESTWRLDDPQFKYRMIDDTRWRLHLAEMWVEKTGASEKGKTLNLLSVSRAVSLLPQNVILSTTYLVVGRMTSTFQFIYCQLRLVQTASLLSFFLCPSVPGLTANTDARRHLYSGKTSRRLLCI